MRHFYQREREREREKVKLIGHTDSEGSEGQKKDRQTETDRQTDR